MPAPPKTQGPESPEPPHLAGSREASDVDPDALDDDDPAAPAQAAAPREGLAAFPAPGTKRIKRGLVVPEDFPLPPGYMRHYQATDKGQMLEPILVFHPDHRPVDENGNPIPLPPDRVVPADMAPPGLSTVLLDIPDDAYANPGADNRSNLDPGSVVADEQPGDAADDE